MFTGIVQGVARVQRLVDRPGLRSFVLALPAGFGEGLAPGASVAVDGVCLTVTDLHGGGGEGGDTGAGGATVAAGFDVMQQSLALTTLAALAEGGRVNVERAARDGAEIGGHPLSGHVDAQAVVAARRDPENNRVLRLALPAPWLRYVFAKGYVAVNGASLTVAEARREADGSGWFEVWLIPETLRRTTFDAVDVGARVNVEIDRATQVFVDTVRAAVDERLGPLVPALEAWLRSQGGSLDELAQPPATLPRA